MRNRFFVAVAAALGVVAASPALASPLSILKKRTEQVASLLRVATEPGSAAERRKKARMKRIIRSFFDYRELAKQSLWVHWKDRSAAERKEFVGLLRQLIEDRVLSNLSSHANFTAEYGAETVQGKTALVKTVIRIPDKPEIEIDYKFTKRGGKWLIFDLDTDGTSLVRNYRSQFNRIIRRDGYNALVKKMRDKLESREASEKVANAVTG
jgi:phospholipid transport system substrate-binding protein